MSQICVATADSSAGTWGVAPLFSKVDDGVTPNDTDLITSAAGGGSVCKLGVLKVTDGTNILYPEGGDYVITFRAKRGATTGASMTVKLYQATTLISTSSAPTLTTSFADFTHTLSAAEALNITDYTDLYFTLTTTSGASYQVQVSNIYMTLPDPDCDDSVIFI